MAEDDDQIGIPRDQIAGIGSERLALALANQDVPAIGQALRHDYVVVPLTRSEGGDPRLLVTSRTDDDGTEHLELPLFSSAQTLTVYAGGDQPTEFSVRRGSSLVAVLEQHAGVLDRVLFDPAGPNPMRASAEDVLASLRPRIGDDEVAWAASAGTSVDLDQLLQEAGHPHPIAIDISLPETWRALDLEHADIDGLARHFFPRRFAKANRQGMERFLTVVIAAAKQAKASFAAATVVPIAGEPLGIALSTSWHVIGPTIGDVPHLERIAERLGGELGGTESLRWARVTGDKPLVEYWLEFPDQRGLASIGFALSNGRASDELLTLTDGVVASAVWVTS